MESSQVLGGTEECSSTESGWTKYIASPIHEDDYDHTGDDVDDDDDDDSMASDASSGPSHHELVSLRSEGSQGRAHFKHAKAKDNNSKCSSGKKPYKQVLKKRGEIRMKVESQEESVLKANSATSLCSKWSQGKKK